MVGYMRRNFLAPVPSFESFEALNAYLERRCLERMDARLRGHTESIGHRMERDLEALLPVAYDACEKRAGRVSSLSLVRYRTNDYSVPVAYGHRDVLVRGCVDWEPRDKREFVQVLRLLESFKLEEVPYSGQGCPPAGGFELRRGEAPGAVPSGGPAAPPRPGAVPLPCPVCG